MLSPPCRVNSSLRGSLLPGIMGPTRDSTIAHAWCYPASRPTFVVLTNGQARGQPQPQGLVVRLDQLLPHDAHGQDEEAVRHELVRHHQHDADDLGGTVGKDGERIACRTLKRQQCK